jgi:uncharacterized oligopeptide transporter (OPT) family protein
MTALLIYLALGALAVTLVILLDQNPKIQAHMRRPVIAVAMALTWPLLVYIYCGMLKDHLVHKWRLWQLRRDTRRALRNVLREIEPHTSPEALDRLKRLIREV